jgi:SAM-dependent methyltransferase
MTVYESALPRTGLRDETYDAVTMSHVIEHLHDPVSALQEVRRILKPGGTLWIVTPNVESIGHRRFGVNWRGLEPPRHLVLFSGASLAEALDRAGFWPVVALPVSLRPFGLFAASHCIAAGLDPNGPASRIPQRIRWLAVSAALRTWLSPEQGEELLVLARKPTQP